jgi:hypothetical protein
VTPVIQTVNPVAPPNGDGPTIQSVKRFGVHMHPTVLVVNFNDPLDPVSAVNLSNYRITGPGGHLVRVKSAVFDAATNSVTLHPVHRINFHHTYRFEVIGTGPNGVRNTEGLLLDGTDSGTPASDYKGTITWRNAVLTEAQTAKYEHPKVAKPTGPLAHSFATSSKAKTVSVRSATRRD